MRGTCSTHYLIDRDHMGQFSAGGDQIVQSLADALPNGAYGMPAYWNNQVYYIGSGDVPKAFQFSQGLLARVPDSAGATTFDFPGAVPVISANGALDGILWPIQRGAFPAAILHAYDATDLSHELYSSRSTAAADFGEAVKFTPPLVANGKVFVATSTQLTAFGLSSSSPTGPGNAGGGGCVGDCTGSGLVSVADLLRLVDIALGNADASTCGAGAAGAPVSVVEILTAVHDALDGCPAA